MVEKLLISSACWCHCSDSSHTIVRRYAVYVLSLANEALRLTWSSNFGTRQSGNSLASTVTNSLSVHVYRSPLIKMLVLHYSTCLHMVHAGDLWSADFRSLTLTWSLAEIWAHQSSAKDAQTKYFTTNTSRNLHTVNHYPCSCELQSDWKSQDTPHTHPVAS